MIYSPVVAVKSYFDWKLVLVCVSGNLLSGLYELVLNGEVFEDMGRNLWSNIFNKVLMFFPIFYTIDLSNTIEAFSKNSALSNAYKELRLFLWILKIRDYKNNRKLYFRSVKHINQIINLERDLLERELPLTSRSVQTCSDVMNNFAVYLLQ